jgi:outer membrane protein insertion porin family
MSPRTLAFGVGYLTDDLFWTRARWRHRNLFGRGRGAELYGSLSQYARTAGATTWWPVVGGSPIRAQLSLGSEESREESYRVLTTTVGLGGRAYLGARVTTFAQFAFSDVRLDKLTEDVDVFLENGGLLAITTLGIDRSSTDDALFPTRGNVSSLRVRLAPWETISRAQFVSGTGTSVGYRKLGRVVAVLRVGAGIAVPLDSSQDILPTYRFFAGGASSMRGFRRRELGPKDDSGAPIGGEAMAQGAFEVRIPLPWRFMGGGFVDTGQVWERRRSFDLRTLQWAAGPMLLVRTPVGPLRADLGFLLSDAPGVDGSPVFHFSIGQPF